MLVEGAPKSNRAIYRDLLEDPLPRDLKKHQSKDLSLRSIAVAGASRAVSETAGSRCGDLFDFLARKWKLRRTGVARFPDGPLEALQGLQDLGGM